MKILFPDPLTNKDQISKAAFLYFKDEKLFLTLRPTISLGITGCNPFDFLEFVHKKNPKWIKELNLLFNLWIHNQKSSNEALEYFNPLKNIAFKTMMLSYPKTEEAYEES